MLTLDSVKRAQNASAYDTPKAFCLIWYGTLLTAYGDSICTQDAIAELTRLIDVMYESANRN